MKSEDDNLTYWLKMFMGGWFGLMAGSLGTRWLMGNEITTEVMAVRALLGVGVGAVWATFCALKRAAS